MSEQSKPAAPNLPKDWDKNLAKLGGHFLQSSEWMEFQAEMGRKVYFAQGDGWQWAGVEAHSRGFSWLYAPYGPTAKGAKAFATAIKSLSDKAHQLGMDFVRVEPVGKIKSQELMEAGLWEVASVQPKYPWVLDITQSEEELRSGMNSGHRSAINGAERRGLSFAVSQQPSKDVEIFLEMMRETTKGRFHTHEADYFRTMLATLAPTKSATLYFAKIADKSRQKPIASAIVYDFGGVRYYAHAAAHQAENRRLQAAAPLLWRMILDAKAAGAKEFNFWGVTPSEDPKHPWAGFSKFKKAFGGHIDEQLGAWELPVRPLRHRLYTSLKKIRG